MSGSPTIDEPQVVQPEVADQEIVLTIPAQPEFLRLARLAAADVGSRCGLAYEEVDDLRIAVDELCHAVMGGLDPAPATDPRTLEMRFVLLVDRVTIVGECASDATPVLNELSTAILSAVVDEYELSGPVGGSNRFRMVKLVRLR